MRVLLQRLMAAVLVLVATSTASAQNQNNNFDLAGPTLSLTVTRGEVTLPIAQVPGLKAKDKLVFKADLPEDQDARYILVLAFLRGATNPPPKNWFYSAETWDRKKSTINATVPEGAEQAIALLAPETGGGYNALVKAVRARPGVFVRASQDLYQASLDRARLETFVAGIAKVEEGAPDRLGPVSKTLASTLAIRLNADCLARPRPLQAPCLTQNREGMVLQTGRTASFADSLAGAPTDLAYSLAATREGGAGFYSPYIALARDVAKLFGAFRSADYQYAPVLAVGAGDRLRLQLSMPPSFDNPKTVMVVPLPAIGLDTTPSLRAGQKDAVCLMRPGLALPLEDEPLVFATDYAHDMSVRVSLADGKVVELPVRADAESGGLVLTGDAQNLGQGAIGEAVLHGRWGFDPFTGPRFPLQNGAPSAWSAKPDNSVVVGRETPVTLQGGAASCVQQVSLRDRNGTVKSVEWAVDEADEITAKLPLARTRPGELTLLVVQYGAASSAQLTLKGQSEASRLEGFTLYTGDREGRLSGARLDQVKELEVAGLSFVPGALARDAGGGDRLTLTTEGNTQTVPVGTADAKVMLTDGRTITVRATVTPPRPRVELVSRNVDASPPEGRALALSLPDNVLPQSARLTFSVRAVNTRLSPGDAIEVATADDANSAKLTAASGALQLVGGDIAVATIVAKDALGPAAVGPIKMRLLQGDLTGEWQPLARVVRLPVIEGVNCNGASCSLAGARLFLVAAVAPEESFAKPVTVPLGFVGDTIDVTRPAAGTLYVKLHDAPDDVVKLPMTQKGGK